LAHILLACLLLIGATGLVVNKHYCQNELKNTALFLKAKDCHSSLQAMNCPMHGDMAGHSDNEERKDCCDDKTEYLKAEEEQITHTLKWALKKNVFVPSSAAWLPLSSLGSRQHRHIVPYLNYKPPLIVYDLQPRLQTFLL
jgi:hypothetical protein